MKTILLSTLILLMISTFALAQSRVVAAKIKVYGNCTMCKKRIETALDHKGIKQASWDPKTKELNVTYNTAKISEKEIHQIVANAGHDTDLVKAKEETYAGLPFCCLYRDGDAGHSHQ